MAVHLWLISVPHLCLWALSLEAYIQVAFPPEEGLIPFSAMAATPSHSIPYAQIPGGKEPRLCGGTWS
jgi:hypothetical protein